MGKRILVTGASGGIGSACARALSRDGWDLYLHYHQNEEGARKVAEEVGGEAEIIGFDLSNREEMLAQIKDLDVEGLVHCAAQNRPALFLAHRPGEIASMIEVNLTHTALLTQVILKKLLRKKRGSLVFISSVVTEKVFRGQALYAAVKGGLEAMVRSLAREYGEKGIRLNLISPGPTNTKMLRPSLNMAGDKIRDSIPLGRIGEPEEIGALAAFLISQKASFITGTNITVDGGYTLG